MRESKHKCPLFLGHQGLVLSPRTLERVDFFMDNSWVKLYRKLEDNSVMRDATALQVLVWCLLKVDKKTGKFTTGRFVGSIQLGLNSNTFYKALKRLEKKYKIVTLNSNNKFTEISLSKWAVYNPYKEVVTQSGNTPSNNKVTPPVTHIQDIKTLRHKDNDKSLQNEEINQLTDYLKRKLELPLLDDSVQSNRRYAQLCIKKFGFEKTKIAIDATSQSKFWHTRITSFKGLYYNAVKIVSSLRGEVKSVDAGKVLDSKNEGREGIYVDTGRVSDTKEILAGGN